MSRGDIGVDEYDALPRFVGGREMPRYASVSAEDRAFAQKTAESSLALLKAIARAHPERVRNG